MREESANPTLVLVSDPHLRAAEIERVRALAAEGAAVVAWQHRPIVEDRVRSPHSEPYRGLRRSCEKAPDRARKLPRGTHRGDGKPQVRRPGERRVRVRSRGDPESSRSPRGRPVSRSRDALVRDFAGFRGAGARGRKPSRRFPFREAQAESPLPYREVVLRLAAERTRILPAEKDLLELLFALDGLITVDSVASSEALVLGRPVLVLNLPGNLDPLVGRGVALGVRRGESIAKALETLLFDPETARALETKRKEYIREFAFGADGRSTERIVECILNESMSGKA